VKGELEAMNAMLATLGTSDMRISGRLQSWNPPRAFRIWMRWATRLGDGWLHFATLAVLAGVEGERDLARAAAVALGAANVTLIVLKRHVRRRRPSDYAPQLCGFTSRALVFDEYSFPSGHALNAFAVGTVVALAFPATTPIVLLLAGSIALSRVALGFHFAGDVVAGGAMGLALGAGAFRLLVG
jgi:undecaprenyl-diphosphatase